LFFICIIHKKKKAFPKLLLLDEPDAHLHPSMTQQFLNVIINVLVDKFDVQVIMTTHSPSTVILAPDDSIYEMLRTEPRISKAKSKNHCVSLLTAGLVFVGEGTKYFLVEDKDDEEFYTYVYNQLKTDDLIDSNIPLVFIPASTKDNSGGKSVVQTWVSKLKDSGLIGILQGLIDADSGNVVSDGVYKIDRYSIENYLADPLYVYAALIDREQNPEIEGVKFSVGEEYKLKNLSEEALQKIANKIFDLVEPELSAVFSDFNETAEMQKVEVQFGNGVTLLYPKWIINRRGKDIINQIHGRAFGNSTINFAALFKAMKKLNMFPIDLRNKLEEIKRN